MKIKSIKIEKFRSIESAYIRMHDITAIVGENNAGKTAILKALNSVLNYEDEKESFQLAKHRFAPKTSSTIVVEFEDVPANFNVHSYQNTLTIGFKYTYSTGKRNLTLIKGANATAIDDSFMTELSRHLIYVYIPAERTDGDTSWDDNSIFKKLVTGYVSKYTKNRDTISTPVRSATEKIHDLALKKLEKEINGLYLQKQDVDFKIQFPEDIDYSVLLTSLSLSMNEHNRNYLLQEWGSGTKSLAVIAMHRANALLNQCSIVLGIEEPETNLHPQAQKRFINSLKDDHHANETQTIFTTHSTVLVDSLQHDDIILVRREKNVKRGFISAITQIRDDFWARNNIVQFKHYQYFNYKNSDFFFSKFVIIGESKNDCQVFEHLIKGDLSTILPDISFIDADGVNKIQYPFFLLKELKIPFVLVVDRDYFFKYKNNDLDPSRNPTTGLPEYKNIMNSNPVLDNLFPTPAERQLIESAHKKGYRKFFEAIKTKGILSMNYCLEMDLTCSNKARSEYYKILGIVDPNKQTQKELLTANKKSIKDIEKIDTILKAISAASYPESYQKIKKAICEIVLK